MPVLNENREQQKVNLAAEILRAGGSIRLIAQGSSMLPAIWPGEVLEISSIPAEAAVVGDIVLVEHDGRFFIHRLIAKSDSGGITRGDSLPEDDPVMVPSVLLGRVCAIHRRGQVIVPAVQRSLPIRALAWVLCRSNQLRNLTLRFHSLWVERAHFGWLPTRSQHRPCEFHEP